MQREAFSAVEDATALTTGILETGRRLTADRGDQVIWISDDCHRLRLLLDVLNFDLLLLLLLLLLGGLLLRLLLGSLCGSGCLLLGLLLCLLLSLSLRLGLSLRLRLLLLNHLQFYEKNR